MAPLRARQPELRRRGHHLRRPRRPAGAVGRGLVLPRRLSAARGRPRVSRLPRGRPPPLRRARRGGDRHGRVRALPVGVRRRPDRRRSRLGGERAVTAAYPSMDVLLLAGLAGFFVTAAWRTPAFLLLVGARRDHARRRRDLRAEPERLHGRRLGRSQAGSSPTCCGPPQRCTRRCSSCRGRGREYGSCASARCGSCCSSPRC